MEWAFHRHRWNLLSWSEMQGLNEVASRRPYAVLISSVITVILPLFRRHFVGLCRGSGECNCREFEFLSLSLPGPLPIRRSPARPLALFTAGQREMPQKRFRERGAGPTRDLGRTAPDSSPTVFMVPRGVRLGLGSPVVDI